MAICALEGGTFCCAGMTVERKPKHEVWKSLTVKISKDAFRTAMFRVTIAAFQGGITDKECPV